jgi:5-methylcytosine-specific restriction enzyme subunit McrC
MRFLSLTEYQTSGPFPLTQEERDAIRELVPSLTVQPAAGTSDEFLLTPAATIGAVWMDSLSVEIRPKLPIDRVMFLISYVLDPKQWRSLGFHFDRADSLVDAIIPGFVRHLRRAFRRGLLQGYRNEEDSLPTVRGRIRFGDQIRGRLGLMPPLEVAYDEYTEDVLENRLLKAAIARLANRRIRSAAIRQELREFDAALAQVELQSFEPRNLPRVPFTRLNAHYESAIAIAKLILQAASLELRRGRYQGAAFLVDMNQVFESFVVTALREALGLSERAFPSNARGRNLYLDAAYQIRLEPDLSWWLDGKCVFIGDVKYKSVSDSGVKHGDLYQLLAYTMAADVPAGVLVYAEGEGTPHVHRIPTVQKQLEVVSMHLDGSPAQVLSQITELANRIRQLVAVFVAEKNSMAAVGPERSSAVRALPPDF